ncbi:MAG TPA: ATP-binding protein [Blastocatellia bacterium]|nr:ATP-binding protein [Blastocatellia bacterium]
MSEAFSFNREFDFVRLDGLRRATGRDPHEWDTYIIKELIDNALDADEVLWREDSSQYPKIDVHIEYYETIGTTQLHVEVSNRVSFPVEKIESIFDTNRYTSRKAFDRGLTRGALGNALKTLLGIPLALFAKTGDGYKPYSIPLSIDCNQVRYSPLYIVDGRMQTVSIAYDKKKISFSEGTRICVNLDHFWQERPRTLIEIKQLAEQYHLCNPHAEFRWSLEIFGQEWNETYKSRQEWLNKFKGAAQIEWYSPPAFHDLLGALYRKQSDKENFQLPVEAICRYFSGFDGPSNDRIATVIRDFKADVLPANDIEGKVATQLYSILCKHSPAFDSFDLGFIGGEHIQSLLSNALPVDGEIIYEAVRDAGNDPGIPFVIEVAVAWLKEGKRQIWTAVNFAPSYEDPFFTRRLNTPVKPDEQVLGLRGMLDAYDLQDDTPLILFLHLVCPNVEHSEFSKSEVNHLPFRDVLATFLDKILTRFKHIRDEEELQLERTVIDTLDAILNELDPDEKFTFGQLLEKLRMTISQTPALAAWLETPGARGRLQAYIAQYESVFMQRVARPSAGALSIPLHPDRHISILSEQASRDFLSQYNINKIIFMQNQELESVAIENRWLSRMDMALLRNMPDREGLRQSLLHCINGSDLPVLILHDADDDGCGLVEQMRSWLKESQLDFNRILDLGLAKEQTDQPASLVSMMPGELFSYLLNEFKVLGIQIKSKPPDSEIRQNLSECFDRLLKGQLWEALSEEIDVARLLEDLDEKLGFTDLMIEQKLDEKIKDRLGHELCAESYTILLNDVVESFFVEFMRERSLEIHKLMQSHLAQIRKR